ncbi:MAG: PAS domain S-box protein, partial [Methanomicrobiales archaeon]|nr:PAS domain S-box protein [Methanomicrobiales archaeon]
MPDRIAILYVDDEESLRELGKTFLETGQGFCVDTAASAAAALEVLATRTYDAIISDYQMPEQNGIEFLKQVRARYGDVPFILFTGRGREAVVIEAINNGCDFYLQKGGEAAPQFAELAHKVRQAVSRHRALVELQAAYGKIARSEEQLRRQLDEISAQREALKKSEESFQDIVETSPDIIWELDEAGTIMYVSGACRDVLGYSPEELTGTPIFTLVNEPAREKFRESFLHGNRTKKELRELDLPLRHSNGRSVVMEIRSIPRLDAHGRPTGFRGVARDITGRRKEEEERQKNELALRESEARFRGLADLLPQMVFETDTDLKITYANEQALTLLGLSRDDLAQGIPVLSLIDPSEQERMKEAAREGLAGITGQPREYRLTKKDGTRFPVLCYSTPISQNGRVVGFRGIVIDISGRKHTEEALHTLVHSLVGTTGTRSLAAITQHLATWLS